MSKLIVTPELEDYENRIRKFSDEELDNEIIILQNKLNERFVDKEQNLSQKHSIAKIEKFFRAIDGIRTKQLEGEG